MGDLILIMTVVLLGVAALALLAHHVSPATRRVRRDRKRRLRLGLEIR